MPRHAPIPLLLALLAACASPPPPAEPFPAAIGPVPLHGGGEGRIEPLRDGVFVLVGAPEGAVPVSGLRGLQDARLVATTRLGEEGLALLAGSVPGCALRHVLVAVRAEAVRSFPLPDCARTYALAPASDGRAVAVHEAGSLLPVVFVYRDGQVMGPVVARPRQP
ncbi:hypothetical protein ACI6QG_15185 [Roseococcus sp. DSY-14]|uniref:hypothetical protein n=1 Tax=Roseococcus sp. DSY-14 TaxID=3369650 RepID=UPI00387A8C72